MALIPLGNATGSARIVPLASRPTCQQSSKLTLTRK